MLSLFDWAKRHRKIYLVLRTCKWSIYVDMFANRPCRVQLSVTRINRITYFTVFAIYANLGRKPQHTEPAYGKPICWLPTNCIANKLYCQRTMKPRTLSDTARRYAFYPSPILYHLLYFCRNGRYLLKSIKYPESYRWLLFWWLGTVKVMHVARTGSKCGVIDNAKPYPWKHAPQYHLPIVE